MKQFLGNQDRVILPTRLAKQCYTCFASFYPFDKAVNKKSYFRFTLFILHLPHRINITERKGKIIYILKLRLQIYRAGKATKKVQN